MSDEEYTSARDQLKKELRDLCALGLEMLEPEIRKFSPPPKKRPGPKASKPSAATQPDKPRRTIHSHYQSWYSRAARVVHDALPERLPEFNEQYRVDKRKQINAATYTISDYLLGVSVTRFTGEPVFDTHQCLVSRFNVQLQILQSAFDRLDSLLADIRGVLQSELFDTELDSAMDLLAKGHLRASGALAGVTLEAHLRSVAASHGVRIRKSSPTISDWNDALKQSYAYDVPTWRQIQRLADIRNLCVHAKDREPTAQEVQDLIEGAARVAKTVF